VGKTLISPIDYEAYSKNYAKIERSVALASLFRPFDSKKNRSTNIEILKHYSDVDYVFNLPEAMNSTEQTVLYEIIHLMQKNGVFITKKKSTSEFDRCLSESITPTCIEIDQEIQPEIDTEIMSLTVKSISMTISRYELIQALHWPINGESYEKLIDCISRMSKISCRVNGHGHSWTVPFLKYIMKDKDETGKAIMYLALNYRFARAINGEQYSRVYLNERKQLSGDLALLTHSHLSAVIKEGFSIVFNVDTLPESIWGETAKTTAIRNSRRHRMKAVLAKIGELQGWTCTTHGERSKMQFTVKRAAMKDHKLEPKFK